MRITTVPLHASDLIRRGVASSFIVSEVYSRPGLIPRHAHAQLSITILLEGSFEEHYDAIHKPRSCSPGSAIVRPAGEAHANVIGRHGGRTLSVELDADRMESRTTLGPLFERLSHHGQGCFLDLGLAMSQELQNADEAAPLALESLSLELLARLIRGRHERSPKSPAKWLQRARDLIHCGSLDEPMRIGQLAAEVGIHPVYFARMFREAYAVTPGEYVRRLRLELARRQLVSSSLSLAEIASTCGFADQSHFARLFRRQFGIAPGAFRRMTRE
jgi:AraC family transcriptional regulator